MNGRLSVQLCFTVWKLCMCLFMHLCIRNVYLPTLHLWKTLSWKNTSCFTKLIFTSFVTFYSKDSGFNVCTPTNHFWPLHGWFNCPEKVQNTSFLISSFSLAVLHCPKVCFLTLYLANSIQHSYYLFSLFILSDFFFC